MQGLHTVLKNVASHVCIITTSRHIFYGVQVTVTLFEFLGQILHYSTPERFLSKILATLC